MAARDSQEFRNGLLSNGGIIPSLKAVSQTGAPTVEKRFGRPLVTFKKVVMNKTKYETFFLVKSCLKISS